MHWLVFAMLTAFAVATEALVLKRFLGHLTSYEMTASFMGWSWVVFGVYLLFAGPQPLADGYWSDLVILVPINILGVLLQFEAIRSGPLSLAMPFLSFTPAFMVLTGFLFLDELPTLWGVGGIGLIVLGSWVLSVDPRNVSFMEPFRAILRERCSRMALLAAIVWAVAAVFSKRLALKGDPMYTGALFFFVHNFVLVAGLVLFRKAKASVLVRHPFAGLACAAVLFIHIYCHYTAITMVKAAYMVAIKRLSGVISVGYGWLFFHDTNVRLRLLGSAVMSGGAVMIVLMG